jgi:hypothetical protein
MEKAYFTIKMLFLKSDSVESDISFKIINDVILNTYLDL